MSLKTARRLRRSMTDAERALWAKLRDGRLDGIKFRRQHPLGPYVLDFFCEAHKLAIEVDGSQHVDNSMDAEWTVWLEARGCRVIRFWNNEVLREMPSVLEAIRAALPVAPHPRPVFSRRAQPPRQPCARRNSDCARSPLPSGEGN